MYPGDSENGRGWEEECKGTVVTPRSNKSNTKRGRQKKKHQPPTEKQNGGNALGHAQDEDRPHHANPCNETGKMMELSCPVEDCRPRQCRGRPHAADAGQ